MEIREDYYKYIDRFAQMIFPQFKINGRYVCYSGVESLELISSGTFGLGSVYKDQDGNENVIKFIFPHILERAQGKREAIEELQLAWEITNSGIADKPRGIISTYAIFNTFNDAGRFIRPDNLIPRKVERHVIEDPKYNVMGIVMENGDTVASESYRTYMARIQPRADADDWLRLFGYYAGISGQDLQYLRDKGYVHYDLKPANMIIKFKPEREFPKNAIIKLIDWGKIARKRRDGKYPYNAGTAIFIPGDVGHFKDPRGVTFDAHPYNNEYSDVFAVGLSLLYHFDFITYAELNQAQQMSRDGMYRQLNHGDDASTIGKKVYSLVISKLNNSDRFIRLGGVRDAAVGHKLKLLFSELVIRFIHPATPANDYPHVIPHPLPPDDVARAIRMPQIHHRSTGAEIAICARKLLEYMEL